MQLSSTTLDDLLGIESRDVSKSRNDASAQDGLADRDEDGTAELLSKEGDGHAGGDIVLFNGCLNGKTDSLHTEADTETGEELVADPVGGAGRGSESSQETLTDHGNSGRDDHRRRVVSALLGDDAGNDGADDKAEDEGNGVDAGLDRVDIMGSLN